MELNRKLSEIESHLILERNLKANAESQLVKLESINQQLSDKLESLVEVRFENRKLEMQLEQLKSETKALSEELKRYKDFSEDVIS